VGISHGRIHLGDVPGSGRADGKQTPLYVSNDDFVFSGAYPHPRFAQGAFTRCLKLLYETHTGKPLEVTRYGKPHNVTYQYDLSPDILYLFSFSLSE
jgi:ribonucleotide monophosphatase NagD (HAD superfamily)